MPPGFAVDFAYYSPDENAAKVVSEGMMRRRHATGVRGNSKLSCTASWTVKCDRLHQGQRHADLKCHTADRTEAEGNGHHPEALRCDGDDEQDAAQSRTNT